MRFRIEKEQAESVSSKKADLFREFREDRQSSYRLKIFNRGRGTARNIRMEVLSGDDLLEHHDLKEKFLSSIGAATIHRLARFCPYAVTSSSHGQTNLGRRCWRWRETITDDVF